MITQTSYEQKENYIAGTATVEAWTGHCNHRILCDNLQYIKGRCADLGSSHGACSILLLKEAGDSVSHIDCYDINIEAINQGRNLAKEHGVADKMTYLATNLTQLPAAENIYDFIQSFHTLEHIYPTDADIVIREAWRILKPGGHLLLSIPYDHAYSDPCHVAFYKEDNLTDLLVRNGFETVYCYKDDRWNEKDLLTGLFRKMVTSS